MPATITLPGLGRAFLLLMALLQAHCSKPPDQSGGPGVSGPLSGSAGSSTSGPLVDDLGRPQRSLPGNARLVSLAPNTSEIICYLGLEPNLAGVTAWCDYPPSLRRLPVVGGMVNPDLERLAILRPDLVLVSTEGTPPRITDALATAGLAWYAIRIETPDDLFNSLRRLSALFPDPAARSQTIAALESRHSALRGRLAGRKLFFQYGGIAPVYSFGKGSLVSALCHTAGGTNLGDAGIGRFPSFGPENLRSLAPERVIILETGSRPPAEWTRFWKRIVPDARLQMAPPDPFQRPGPRLIEAFHELADTL